MNSESIFIVINLIQPYPPLTLSLKLNLPRAQNTELKLNSAVHEKPSRA